MFSVPSYLWLSRHSIFYFRIVVPGVLRPLFPCSEIRRSLQTRCKREALIRGRELLLQVQQLYTQAFQGIRPSLDSLRGAWEAGGKRVASWGAWLRQQQLVALAQKPLELGEGGKVRGPLKPGSAPSRAKQGQPDRLIADAPSNAPRFSKVVQECLEQQSHEGLAAKTLSDKRSVAELMTRIVGDLPVDLITRQDARKFREVALKLPPRMNQLPEGQSLEQIIETAISTISLTTFNNYVKNLTTFSPMPSVRATASATRSMGFESESAARSARSAASSARTICAVCSRSRFTHQPTQLSRTSTGCHCSACTPGRDSMSYASSIWMMWSESPLVS
ncbi:DUF6538 domain-containing protein [Pseudomonas sp. HTZ2]|uniref:DUF6538 domain-containing protein n=1 Tax=Pseudomonas sp. HTZ2 TaxID=3075220 RepID=UPI0029583424|nr:DUF6538 domain-containing protein [Pseudomonas sp. HTZ2]